MYGGLADHVGSVLFLWAGFALCVFVTVRTSRRSPESRRSPAPAPGERRAGLTRPNTTAPVSSRSSRLITRRAVTVEKQRPSHL